MELLGQLGIDPVLLAAQILNFVLLVWILKRFLYRPIIQRIERDEEDLKKASAASSEIEKQQANLQIAIKQQRAKSTQEARRMISEAEAVAEDLRQQALRRGQREAEAIVERTKASTAEGKRSARATSENRSAILEGLGPVLARGFPPSILEALSDAYFDLLIKKITTLPTSGGVRPKTARLQSARTPSPKELKRLRETLASRLGMAPEIRVEKRVDLLSGFRLEVSGSSISCDLASDLLYAEEKG